MEKAIEREREREKEREREMFFFLRDQLDQTKLVVAKHYQQTQNHKHAHQKNKPTRNM